MRNAPLLMGLALVAGLVALSSAVSLSFLRLNLSYSLISTAVDDLSDFFLLRWNSWAYANGSISDDFFRTPNYQETEDAHRLFVQFCTS